MSKTEIKQKRMFSLHKEKTKHLLSVKVLQIMQNLESEPLRFKDTVNAIFELVSSGGHLLVDRYQNRYVELPTGEVMELSPLAKQFINDNMQKDLMNILKKESGCSQQLDGWIDKVPRIKDFPSKGILFYDLIPILSDPFWLSRICHHIACRVRNQGITKIAALEARGFFIGTCLADILGVKMIPIRKKGKLPGETLSVTYDKEYGTDTLELQENSFSTSDNVLVVDDILATGGTALSAKKLLSSASSVSFAFVISLEALEGKDRLKESKVISLWNA